MAKRGSTILRWLKRIGLGVLALIALAVMFGSGFEAYARHKARKDYPPPARLVDIGGRKMHIDCRGQGFPIVVLEAGLDTNGTLAWSAVHDKIAATTRTCAYDRAGVMWSQDKPGPHDADGVARDLHALLQAAGEKGPFVMVGHSLGGPYIMDFTRQYPADVAGLVFVDASHPDQVTRFKAINPNMPATIPQGPVLMSKLTWLGWTRIPTPDPPTPNVSRKMILESKAYMATSLPAAMNEGVELDHSLAEAGKLRTLGDRPIVVLTANKPYPAEMLKVLKMDRAGGERFQAEWRKMHDEEASWSTRSRHELVPDATHYIQFDRPDVVIAAVKEVVAKVRLDHQPTHTIKP